MRMEERKLGMVVGNRRGVPTIRLTGGHYEQRLSVSKDEAVNQSGFVRSSTK